MATVAESEHTTISFLLHLHTRTETCGGGGTTIRGDRGRHNRTRPGRPNHRNEWERRLTSRSSYSSSSPRLLDNDLLQQQGQSIAWSGAAGLKQQGLQWQRLC